MILLGVLRLFWGLEVLLGVFPGPPHKTWSTYRQLVSIVIELIDLLISNHWFVRVVLETQT